MRFDVKEATDASVTWIRNWFEQNGKGCNAIVGISGGKDSSVVASLLAKALGKDRVIGVLMPKGVQDDIDMAKLLVNHLGIKSYTININNAYEGLINELQNNLDNVAKDSKINLPARLRMSTLYAVAQSSNGRVANTCNLSEDWVGYSTRYGDSVGDFSPISCFTTNEIREIGRYLGLPSILVDKTPVDGLSGLTDEEKLGFTYEVLDKYIRTGKIEDMKTKERIDYLNKINQFKMRFMDSFNYWEDNND
ncbi:MAG TPA: NAD(+) synthase [Anaerovoracaceae bacterium]|nr:NAD(+) synthase [Anaerovoracaceae bacterium]